MLGLLLFPFLSADGHGCGSVRVANQPVGRFLATICISPEPVRTGTIHVSVALSDAETNAPLLNQRVMVTLDQDALVPATSENATNRLFHEADLEIDMPGIYQIGVMIADEEPVTFEITADPAPLLPPRTIAAFFSISIMALIYALSRRKQT